MIQYERNIYSAILIINKTKEIISSVGAKLKQPRQDVFIKKFIISVVMKHKQPHRGAIIIINKTKEIINSVGAKLKQPRQDVFLKKFINSVVMKHTQPIGALA